MPIAALAALFATAAWGQSSPNPEPPRATMPTIPPATIDDSLEINGQDVKARQVRTRLAVPVRVNGQGPFRFIVDSGADRTVIGEGLAQRLGLPAGPDVTVHSMAGAGRAGTAQIALLRIGTSDIDDITAPTLPEEFLGAQGLIGIDALVDQRLMLDFDKKTIAVQDARRPVEISADEIVVTARRRHGQLILTQVEASDSRIFAIIDTGAEITIGNSALLKRIFRGRNPPPAQPLTITSVTGQQIETKLIVLPRVKIGALVLERVPVAFADVPPFALFGLASDPAMLLGTDVLESFRRVSLDFRSRKVRFQLRR